MLAFVKIGGALFVAVCPLNDPRFMSLQGKGHAECNSMDIPSNAAHESSLPVFASKTGFAFPVAVEEEEVYLEQVAKRH
jgi:hypothetical protein